MLGVVKVVVSMKKVISKKPKSTIGVMSGLADVLLIRRLPFAGFVSISAIIVLFYFENLRSKSNNRYHFVSFTVLK
jgi:hypothetical protein